MQLLYRWVSAFLVAASPFSGAFAAAVVMDFGSGSTQFLSVYVEDGFRIAAINSGAGTNHFDVFDFSGANGEREADVHSGNNAEEILIDFFGSPFDLLSIDIELVAGPNTWSIFSSSGGSQLISSTGTILFSGSPWEGITSLTVRPSIPPPLPGGTGTVVFDNITFDNDPFADTPSVPEPATLLLLGIGLAGLGFAKKRLH